MALTSPFAASGGIAGAGVALEFKTVFVDDAEGSYAPRRRSPLAITIFEQDSCLSSQSSLSSTPRELNLSRRTSFSSDGVREIDDHVKAGEFYEALTKIDDGAGE
jgi:hypothetical protein